MLLSMFRTSSGQRSDFSRIFFGFSFGTLSDSDFSMFRSENVGTDLRDTGNVPKVFGSDFNDSGICNFGIKSCPESDFRNGIGTESDVPFRMPIPNQDRGMAQVFSSKSNPVLPD